MVQPLNMSPEEAQATMRVLANQCPSVIPRLSREYLDELIRAALADYSQYLRSREEVFRIRAERRRRAAPLRFLN